MLDEQLKKRIDQVRKQNQEAIEDAEETSKRLAWVADRSVAVISRALQEIRQGRAR
ncbi:MAG TPA: hypothetical protein VK480_04135 [Solirubrobacterales bacterium]|nr:hypothetical protein [Solirubrobacterales bacterium]